MQTTIRRASRVKAKESVIIILDERGNLPKGYLSKDETAFVNAELKADKKSILINQYKRIVGLFQPDYKKDESRLLEGLRKAGDQFLAAFNKQKLNHAVILDHADRPDLALAMAEGMALGNYQFLKYRKEAKKEKNSLQSVEIVSKTMSNRDLNIINNVVAAVYESRTLVNEPQSWLTATKMATEFARMGREAGFKVSIYNKAKIRSLKMGGLLAVNQGSEEPPTFTIMEYRPKNAKNKKPYVLVGKGVVYDTGGLSLKPTPNSMDYMKCDMAGGAAVAGAIYSIAKSKLPVHVIALVPSTDNRPSGEAYTPGDVITMMSGHTVEVLNTDAEGRLILADALHFAKRYKPELVMDFATLTGAAAAAIGQPGMVAMGTADEKTKAKMQESGNRTYERIAEFPIWDEYDEMIKSDIADMKNIGGPAAGAITAGKFLQRYIDYPWMHFDIAAPAFTHAPSSYRGKGGTGFAVRFLTDFFAHL